MRTLKLAKWDAPSFGAPDILGKRRLKVGECVQVEDKRAEKLLADYPGLFVDAPKGAEAINAPVKA